MIDFEKALTLLSVAKAAQDWNMQWLRDAALSELAKMQTKPQVATPTADVPIYPTSTTTSVTSGRRA